MNQRTFFRRAFVLSFFLLFCVPCLNGCGKAGMPTPQKTQDTFTITGATASFMNNCLVARATVIGAIRNVATVAIEVAPIQSFDDCPGCPFVPQEYEELSSDAIQLDQQAGTFLASFCPSVASPMYRWRLVGKNVHPGLPHATTTPQVALIGNQ